MVQTNQHQLALQQRLKPTFSPLHATVQALEVVERLIEEI